MAFLSYGQETGTVKLRRAVNALNSKQTPVRPNREEPEAESPESEINVYDVLVFAGILFLMSILFVLDEASDASGKKAA